MCLALCGLKREQRRAASLTRLISDALYDFRWGVEFIDPKSTGFVNLRGQQLEMPGIWRSLPFTYRVEFDEVVAAQEGSSSEAASPPTTGRFQQIQTMSDYRALFSCVHLFQQQDHWQGLLGMLLVSSALHC